MFKLEAKNSENSKELLSEVFVIGGIQNALEVGHNLIDKTGCEIVEIFKQKTKKIVAVLKKAARSSEFTI